MEALRCSIFLLQFAPMTKSFAEIRVYRPLAFWFLLGAVSLATAQTGPQRLVEGTIVTGQCNGHESEPGCVLPSLFGPQGLSLYNNPAVPHFAHFIGSAQATLNQTLGTAIATQLATLPIISPASGFTYKYDSGTGAFARSTTTFGPIYTERAETIGRGKVYFGASYQRFRFDSLYGIDLHNVPSVFSHIQNSGENGTASIFEADVIGATNNVTFNMDQTLLFGTVGVTDRIDLSVAVPIVSARMGASSSDRIVRVSGQTYVPSPGADPLPNPHQFNEDPLSFTNVYGAKGSATGIGDVSIRIKGNVIQGETVRVAVALDIRTPTGNARELLGSGSTGIKPFIAISAGKRVSPHANIGYQYNGSSFLAGTLRGTTIGKNSPAKPVFKNGPATKGHVPGNFFFAL